jgi:hypothetical protein
MHLFGIDETGDRIAVVTALGGAGWRGTSGFTVFSLFHATPLLSYGKAGAAMLGRPLDIAIIDHREGQERLLSRPGDVPYWS